MSSDTAPCSPMPYALIIQQSCAKSRDRAKARGRNVVGGRATTQAAECSSAGAGSQVRTHTGYVPLDHRQAGFAHRLLARPRDGGGPEEILAREGAAITTRVRAAGGIRRGETVEPQVWSEDRAFPGGGDHSGEGSGTGRGQELGQPQHHLDGWIAAGQWRCGSGMCLEQRWRVGRARLLPGQQQGGL